MVETTEIEEIGIIQEIDMIEEETAIDIETIDATTTDSTELATTAAVLSTTINENETGEQIDTEERIAVVVNKVEGIGRMGMQGTPQA